jgi:hypothetical protein
MDCQLRNKRNKRKQIEEIEEIEEIEQTEKIEKIEKINQKKRARINSDLNEIHKFESQSKIYFVDLKTIEKRLEVNGFSLNELTRSCINKFKDKMKNNIINNDLEKLQLKSILKNIKKKNELKEYIDSSFLDLIYYLSLNYANYQLTYVLHEINKIRKIMIINELYNDEIVILTQSVKILIYYIFINTIEEEREERKN